MWILTFVSVLAVAVFLVGYWLKKRELPESLSACVYAFDSRNAQMVWTGFVWVSGVCGMIPLTAKMCDLGVVGFVVMAFLAFVGIMPLTDKKARPWHYTLALFAGVLSQVCVALVCAWWLLVWLVMAVLIGGCMCALNDAEKDVSICDGKGVLIAECLCALSVWGVSLV